MVVERIVVFQDLVVIKAALDTQRRQRPCDADSPMRVYFILYTMPTARGTSIVLIQRARCSGSEGGKSKVRGSGRVAKGARGGESL